MIFRIVLWALSAQLIISYEQIDRLGIFKHDNFPIYWNVPSFMCSKYGINFADHTKRYGIIANEDDSFRGSRVNILYDPGAFPAVLKSTSGKSVERNGGIPQLGNITYHLEALTSVITQLMPKNYSGIGIIDFEAWRPIFRQNFGDQTIYTNMSKELVQQKHPQYGEKKVQTDAVRQFERASKVFLESSLKLVRQLRPHGRWGYYGYPYCYNYRKNTGMKSACSKQVQKENNQIQWLFDESDALYPSLYMGVKPPVDAKGYVTGRMNEAVRVARRVSPDPTPQINPYMWYKYFDSLDFLSEHDIYTTMETVRSYKAGGFILWGSSNDFTTREKCHSVLSYLNRVLGPAILRVRASSKEYLDDEVDFIPVEGERQALPSNNSSNFHYDVHVADNPQSSVDSTTRTNELSASSSGKNQSELHPLPNVVIYSAIDENGTARTVYKHEADKSVPATNFVALPQPEKVPNTTPRHVRSAGNDFKDVPLLREYMEGFENVLNAIARRWSKAFKRKRRNS